MTREESIQIIKERNFYCIECIDRSDKCCKALKKAIEALEKLDKIENIINSDLGDKYAYDEILEVLEGVKQ